MKNILIALTFMTAISQAQECTETQSTVKQDVVYEVNKDMPKHLKGATITVTLADGSTSTVSADKFMVVPRKQYTKLGENKAITVAKMCKAKSRKNSIMVDARNDFDGLDKKTSAITGGVSAKVTSSKALIPGLNYYRREIMDSHLGLGAGVDANGTLKGMIGLDF